MADDHDKPDWWGMTTGAPVALRRGRVVIGRSADADLDLSATPEAAPRHAVVEQLGDAWHLIDQSANGTYHNGRHLRGETSAPLSAGDTIRIGETEINVVKIDPFSPELSLIVWRSRGPTGSHDQPRPETGPPPPPRRPVDAASGGGASMDMFLAGAGLAQLSPDLDAAAAMRTLGESTRVIVQILAEAARRRSRHTYRMKERHPRPNRNPFRFMIDEDDMILVLLGKAPPPLPRGAEAVRIAGDELLCDRRVLVDSFCDMIDDIFANLSPDRIDGAGGPRRRLFRDDSFRKRYTAAHADLQAHYKEVLHDIRITARGEEERP